MSIIKMRDIFETYSISELRKFASSYNKNVKIAGASKMKKPDLIDALMKHTQFFKDVKKKVPVVKPPRKPTPKAPEPKPQPKSTPKAPEPKQQPKSTPKAPVKTDKNNNEDVVIKMLQDFIKTYSADDIKNREFTSKTLTNYMNAFNKSKNEINRLINKMDDKQTFIMNLDKKLKSKYKDAASFFFRRIRTLRRNKRREGITL